MAPEWFKSALVVLAASSTARAGWYLDKSCYANSDMIQKTMSSAFDLAKAGETVLDRVTSKPDPSWTNEQKLTQKAELDLVTYVFKELLKDKDTVDGTSVEYRDARFTLSNVLNFAGFKGLALSANVETVDKQIAQTENKPYQPPPAPPKGVNTVSASEYTKNDNIFVYCDFSRFGPEGKDCNGKDIAPRASDKRPYKCNKNLNKLTVSSDLSDKCEHQDPKSDGRTDMYTSSFGGPKFDPNDHSKLAQPKPKNVISSEIQICPAYLDVWVKDKIKTFADQGQKPAAGRSLKSIFKAVDKALDKTIEKVWNLEGLTPMDVYKTSDVIMVHEMTHGIFGYGLNDVDGSKAYGWKNIRAISDRKSSDNTLKATNNADNFGYFCLGSKMISPGGSKEAQRANEDGTISPLLPKGGKSKRSEPAVQAIQQRQEKSPYEDQSPKESPFTTLQRIVKRAEGPSSSQSSRPSSHSANPGPSSHHKDVKYHTVETVITTIITKELTVPYTTIDETGGGGGPGPSSKSGKSSSGHHKSTSKHGASSSDGGPKPSSKANSESKSKSQSHHEPTSKPSGKSTSKHGASSSSGGGGGVVNPSSKANSESKSKSHSQSHHTPTSKPSDKPTSQPGGSQPSSKPNAHSSNGGGHGTTTSKPQSTASNAPVTTVTVTSDHQTSTVVYIGLPLPTGKPGDPKDPLGWKCTGPLCDPKCLFPILCKSTPGSGVWGLITGWIPKLPLGKPPAPGGPSPPPKPPGNDDPPKSQPNESGPSKTDKPTESKPTKSHSSTTSCKPRTTSVCNVVATQIQGPDGKETTKRVTQSCQRTTLHDCTTQVHGGTSTAAITQAAVTAIEFGDDFEMGISDWEETRDAALAALVADTTDPYDYPDATGSQASKSSQPSAKPTTSKPSVKPTTSKKPSDKPSSKPSAKPSSEPPKPSSKPSSKPTSTASSPKPSSTKYTDRCKDWSFEKNSVVLEGTCTDKDGKEVKTKEDLGLCLHYNNGGLSPQNNGGISKDCTYCFFNPPDWVDHSTVWCVCKNDKDPFAKTASINVDDVVQVMDNGFVKCFDHISAPA